MGRFIVGFWTAAVLATAGAWGAANPPHAPYAGQESREIKALDPAFVEGLEAGAGLGFAKSAELNGYPGPAHLIELADQIPLDADQLSAIVGIRDAMRSEAIVAGRALLQSERALEGAFRQGGVSAESLDVLTSNAGAARAAVRAAHLRAHISATAILSARQIKRYQVLRGYRSHSGAGDHRHKH